MPARMRRSVDLPVSFVEYLTLNPVFHCVELVRDGFYHSYDSQYGSALYPFAVALTLTFFALVFERASRVRIELS
jgi:ABC-type polysaccharide/polyol phosphate export permease